jgi:hypothetical protein
MTRDRGFESVFLQRRVSSEPREQSPSFNPGRIIFRRFQHIVLDASDGAPITAGPTATTARSTTSRGESEAVIVG